jgi:hypothetical protein
MKLYTDVTTLSQLYPLFAKAGLEGMLTGDFETYKDLTLPKLSAKLLRTGKMAEICTIITRSEVYIPDPNDLENGPNGHEDGLNDPDNDLDLTPKPWGECTLEECMGVIVPFFIDITVGPIDLARAMQLIQNQEQAPETSS